MFSAVSSSFVIDVQTGLAPDPNDMTAAYLRAILLTLNNSAIPGELPNPPAPWSGPPQEIVVVTSLLYASLLMSLLAAFVAMLGKQWLNRYLRDTGGSMAERCGDRQRKRNGIEKWPFEIFVESLPVMLQLALLLLAIGLSRYMWTINTSVAYTLLGLTAFGVGFFLLVIVAGTSSYECPFQTPASLALRALGVHRTFGRLVSSLPPLGIRRRLRKFGRSLGQLYFRMQVTVFRIKTIISRTLNQYAPLAHTTREITIVPLPHQVLLPGNLITPIYTSQLWALDPILKEQNLSLPRRANRDDARCINWILDRITDPEAINSALRLACTIRWYDDGVDSQPSYEDLNVVLVECFGFDGKVHPGMRNRAYDSARAISRLYVLAWARSEELADTRVPRRPPWRWAASAADDHDLKSTLSLLYAFSHGDEPPISEEGFVGISASHTTWVSDLLLHLEWARRDNYERVLFLPALLLRQNLPLPAIAVANILMTACISLDWPVSEEVLLVNDKSYVHETISCGLSSQTYSFTSSASLKEISSHFSRAVIAAANPPHPCNHRLAGIVESLVHLEGYFTFDHQMAYDWCSAICHYNQDLGPHRDLLFACLRIGFRRFDIIPSRMTIPSLHHLRMLPLVFSSKDEGAIGDLLCVWCPSPFSEGIDDLVPHIGCLMDLVHLRSFGPRLQHLVFRTLGRMEYTDIERAGLPRLIALLDRIEDEAMFRAPELRDLFLDMLGSPEGRHAFPLRYWRVAAELTVRFQRFVGSDLPKMDLIRFLEAEHEWEKLTWWIGTIWTSIGVDEDQMEEIVRSTKLVVRYNPEAATTIENLVKNSRGLVFGVQHEENLRDALENRSDGSIEPRHS